MELIISSFSMEYLAKQILMTPILKRLGNPFSVLLKNIFNLCFVCSFNFFKFSVLVSSILSSWFLFASVKFHDVFNLFVCVPCLYEVIYNNHCYFSCLDECASIQFCKLFSAINAVQFLHSQVLCLLVCCMIL